MNSSTIEVRMARSGGLKTESWLAVLARPIKRGIVWIAFRRQLRRDIEELMTLDDRMLRDIGLSRGEIEHAMPRGRPFDGWNDRRYL
jgi:uncharacterized protein YjiS (DUF1127 family)